uniref:Uncharacterized protein n=1 Tax=Salix viminalis TaxID=40686 RepID=A0A6N2KY98_SALVM
MRLTPSSLQFFTGLKHLASLLPAATIDISKGNSKTKISQPISDSHSSLAHSCWVEVQSLASTL